MEVVFEAITQAHSQLARKRVMGDLRVLTRDTEDLVKATLGDLRQTVRRTLSQHESTTAGVNHPYGWAGTAFGVGLLVGVLIGRK